MATLRPGGGGGTGDNSTKFLSLTGQLYLQEKKEKRGKVSFKKKVLYWFWFDEKECLLKYYKNHQNYLTSLHKFEGSMDLKDAKVTPAYVAEDGLDFKDALFSAKTFLIHTSNGKIYALTAETDADCHNWIEKLQEKRATWDKKENKTRSKPVPQPKFLTTQDGLVRQQDRKSPGNFGSTSHVQRIFEKYLDSDQLALPRCSSYPHSAFRGNHTSNNKTDEVHQNHDEDVEKDGRVVVRTSSQHSSQSSDSVTETDGGAPLSPEQKEIIELRLQLHKSNMEKEKLYQTVITLEDKLQEQYNEKETLLSEKEALLNEIDQLNNKIQKLTSQSPMNDVQVENSSLYDVIDQLKRSLRLIDGEIELYKTQLKDRDKKVDDGIKRLNKLEMALLDIKKLYVSLLNTSFKIPIPTLDGFSTEDPDPFQQKLKADLLNLVRDELSGDSELIDASEDLSVFEDQYGELHDWNNDTNIFHFLCRKLYLHYTIYERESVVQEWYDYVNGLKVSKKGHWEIPSESSSKREELIGYLRKGIPEIMRTKMWSSIVDHYTGKMREFKNSTAKGGNYYQSLVNTSSPMIKAIQTDLHRTIPNNKHFRQNEEGCVKLGRILVAYSNHNRNIGYCQGMNMIAALGLLYLDEESAFWYLVAIVDKILPVNYFSHGLSACRADQTVMLDLVGEKLETLKAHLDDYGIDLTIVAFKWFLTLFVDGLPTESVLRVMDCFLVEGRPIIFRVSLAIFKLFQDQLLNITDPVTLFMLVKEISKHIFNMDEIFEVAFNDFKPFPTLSSIDFRCKPYLKEFLQEWKEREQLKLSPPPSSSPNPFAPPPSVIPVFSIQKQKKSMQWECGTQLSPKEVWLCSGDRQNGRICVVESVNNGFKVTSPDVSVTSKILCIRAFPNGFVMIGTLDFYIHAISTSTMKEAWSVKLNDSVLDFVWHRDKLVCALADGYISTLQTIGELPGCGKAITILEARNHDPIEAIITPEKAGKVYKMEQSSHGIWVTFKNCPLVCLYDTEHLVQLMAVDHSSLLPPGIMGKDESVESRVTVVSVVDNLLWVGTGNASVHVFKILLTGQKLTNRAKPSPLNSEATESFSLNPVMFEGDSGLLNSRRESFTLPTRRHAKGVTVPAGIASDDSTMTEELRTSTTSERQTLFGQGFRKRSRQEYNHGATKNESAAIYKMEYVWSSKLFPDAEECLRLTVMKEIKQNGKSLLLTCVNSSSVGDRAVQVWGGFSNQDNQPSEHKYEWSYTTLPDCYDAVNRDTGRQSLSPIPVIGVTKPRSFSTVIGSLSPTEMTPVIEDNSAEMAAEQESS